MGLWILGWLLLGCCVAAGAPAEQAHPAGRFESMDHVGSAEKAYLSLPTIPPAGGLVLVPDWWGLREGFLRLADGFAADGYIVVAVDLFDGKVPKTSKEAQERMDQVNRPGAFRIINSAIRLLKEDHRVRVPKIGLVGWSTGAGLALETAVGNPDVSAAVLYYGPVVLDPERLRQLPMPLLCIYGTRDAWITPDVAGRFRNALRVAGAGAEFLEFDAAHCFANPGSAAYDPKAAQKAHARVVAFLNKHLIVAPPAVPLGVPVQ